MWHLTKHLTSTLLSIFVKFCQFLSNFVKVWQDLSKKRHLPSIAGPVTVELEPLYSWGIVFFIVSVFTTLDWFNKALRRNVYLKNITIIVNKFSIINCKFIIILFVAFLCSMMYPWFLNLFYRYGHCNQFDEKPADNCIHITGNFISKIKFNFN